MPHPQPPVLKLVPLDVARDWNASPLPGVTNIEACGDPASSDSRIITPAFVHALTF